jgi:transposase
MKSLIYVGADVHTTNYTISCYSIEDDYTFGTTQISPDYKVLLKFLKKIKETRKDDVEFVVGYEAGCLGYTLQRQLEAAGVTCKILAPSTIPVAANARKTDRRDSENIARCLAYNSAKFIYVPTKDDEAVKDYVRMVEDMRSDLTKLKQRINHYCIRQGMTYKDGSHWTKKHEKWLKDLDFGNALANETMQEYLDEYNRRKDTIERYQKRIDEIAAMERYHEKVSRLTCIKGIDTYTALSLVAEVGDFSRFASAGKFAAYLGLVPGESSSGDDINHLSISKAGNKHLRKLLTESGQSYRSMSSKKSKALKERQEGNTPEVIHYADKAAERLTRKFHRMFYKKTMKWNICVTAVARELACFVWGMMTDHMADRPVPGTVQRAA